MSQNSYDQKLSSLHHDFLQKKVELRGERHFTIDEIDALKSQLVEAKEKLRREKEAKFYMFLAGIVFGIIIAAIGFYHK